MDFIVQDDERYIIPFEVKAGTAKHARSITQYCKKFNPEKSVLTSLDEMTERIIPLYAFWKLIRMDTKQTSMSVRIYVTNEFLHYSNSLTTSLWVSIIFICCGQCSSHDPHSMQSLDFADFLPPGKPPLVIML